LRVAIVHYWLVGMWGGDKVVDALLDLYPNADIYTHVQRPEALNDRVRARIKGTTFIDRLPGARKNYQKYLPLMPIALEQLDLTEYDLVISSESGPAKGVITRPETLHICYCHSPMRYAWNMYAEHMTQLRWPMRPIARLLMHRIRLWDRASADRVDRFISNSRTVAGRVAKYYRRDSAVVHPPVDVDRFTPTAETDGSYLCVGRLVPYKRADLAVEAFTRSGLALSIVGGGPDEERLRALAGPNIRFLGRVSDAELDRLYQSCKGLIFPGEEDFGIVPVEAMAAGKPVIALGRGGASETVIDGETGVLFAHETVDALQAAIERAESIAFSPEKIAAHAARFRKERFLAEMKAEIDRSLAAFHAHGPLGPDRAALAEADAAAISNRSGNS
jgi:glycosyltransferase involved in cell wall biosynthesis